ncbi:MAG: DUF3078 domain-containing protein [Porphyromonas sp.]|nr:DUF3078 domain-containing protein [Porphyromonas sp.]
MKLRFRNISVMLLLALSFGMFKSVAQETVKEKDSSSQTSSSIAEILSKQIVPMPEGYTYRDTTIFSPLFLPLVFDIEKMWDEKAFAQTVAAHKEQGYKLLPPTPSALSLIPVTDSLSVEPAASVLSFVSSQQNVKSFLRDFMASNVALVSTTSEMLPKAITLEKVDAQKYDNRFEVKQGPAIAAKDESFETVKVDPIYWIKGFESTIQFSQNHISKNWHKGGTSNLNIFARNFFSLSYVKNKIKWVTELESKIGIYNAPNDTVNKYKISEDLLRLYSNFGIKASSNWYYTLSGELRTQLLKNRKENSKDLITALLSPLAVDAGLGMKYEIDKKFESDKFKRLRFSANIAPFSVSYKATVREDIDKARAGLNPDQTYIIAFGSTMRAALNFDISQTVNWQSRFFYGTTFKRIETEWENTLSISLNRYFSTRLNVNLRYDDAVKNTGGRFKDLLQFTELFSFGFNYKLR